MICSPCQQGQGNWEGFCGYCQYKYLTGEQLQSI